ncbi:AN1-type zinc finger protein 2A-like [Artemia franciscana]|uniref:AN1-type zinc finger protein 2A-like n=1 Tax=Artemia franciscana TaxID=6661 RepID=UPI0032DBA5DD
MELPDLGKHCSVESCHQLDFLPFKCDACGKIFCLEHYKYNSHSCTSAEKKNVQVPVCPLCNGPVPGNRDDPPDIAVSGHIDNDCKSDPAKAKRKLFSNLCSYKKCKQKEMIPVVCSECKRNYCLKHRHTTDHECQGRQAAIRDAALRRMTSRGVRNSKVQPSLRMDARSLQGGVSEEEALRRALELSKASDHERQAQSGSSRSAQEEEEDEMLARAIALSEREGGSKNCSVM